MRKVRILRQAAEESKTAADWYERERHDLGSEFADAVEAAIDIIEDGFLPLSPMPGNPALRELNASFSATSPTTSLLCNVVMKRL